MKYRKHYENVHLWFHKKITLVGLPLKRFNTNLQNDLKQAVEHTQDAVKVVSTTNYVMEK